MARIIHAEQMLSAMTSKKPVAFSMEITDPLIPENNGVFFCDVSGSGTAVKRCRRVPDVKTDITALTAVLFGYQEPECEIFHEIRPFSPVWINEIV